MGIPVVLEDAEVPIEADINAGRLHQVDGVRLEPMRPASTSALMSRSESNMPGRYREEALAACDL